jgi:hypothetical protein
MVIIIGRYVMIIKAVPEKNLLKFGGFPGVQGILWEF